FFQAEDGIRDRNVTGVQTCALPISSFEQGTQITVSTADVDGINAVMARAVIMSGHVTDATGQIPVAGFQVNALVGAGQCCQFVRSEERRVGKEGGSRGWRCRGEGGV